MSDYLNIVDFLEPVQTASISGDNDYQDTQVGKTIAVFEDRFPDLDPVQIVLLGCGEQRGAGTDVSSEAADAIRREFYQLYNWHSDVLLADIGNIRKGNHLTDTYAAMKVVLHELMQIGKVVIILGGSHDLTLGQYYAFAENKKPIDIAGIDAALDLDIASRLRSNQFLMEMLTSEPNYLNHYNHLAFQSYLVPPRMMETMDKLRFDCFRLGHIRENIEEMEPVIRNCQMLSFDISAIAHAYAPANTLSPNGLNGEEACTLMQFAGMSPRMMTAGIYGYDPAKDVASLTAKQIAHMLWYFVDGRSRGVREVALEEREFFNEYRTAFAEVETLFLQSKKTGRWWMQLPDKQFIACSYRDYLAASANELPERWLRAQERP